MNSVCRLLAFVSLVACFIAASGCISRAKYDEVVGRNRIQQERILSLETQMEQERLRADQLQRQLDLLKQTEPFWQQKINALQEQLAERQRIIDQLSEQVGKLALPPELSSAIADWARQAGTDLVFYDEKSGIVRFTSDLLFEVGEDTVQPTVIPRLEKLAEIMNSAAAQGFDLIILGHTDDIPIAKPETRLKHPTNWHLSAHRAISVEAVLARSGIAETRMAIMGMGQFRPIEPNAPDQKGNPKNRRVEIYIVPTGQIRISL